MARPKKKISTPTVNASTVNASILSTEEQMKRHLEKDDKVMFIIPLDKGETIGARLPVNLNGYKIEYPKGRMIEVPTTVMNLLMEKYHMEVESGSKMRADRDAKTSEALS